MHDQPQNSVQLIHNVRVKSGKEFPQLSDFCQYTAKLANQKLFKLIVETPTSYFSEEGEFKDLAKHLNTEFFAPDKGQGKWVKMVGKNPKIATKRAQNKRESVVRQKTPQL